MQTFHSIEQVPRVQDILVRARQQQLHESELLASTVITGGGQNCHVVVPYHHVIMCITQDHVKSLFLTRQVYALTWQELMHVVLKVGKTYKANVVVICALLTMYLHLLIHLLFLVHESKDVFRNLCQGATEIETNDEAIGHHQIKRDAGSGWEMCHGGNKVKQY